MARHPSCCQRVCHLQLSGAHAQLHENALQQLDCVNLMLIRAQHHEKCSSCSTGPCRIEAMKGIQTTWRKKESKSQNLDAGSSRF